MILYIQTEEARVDATLRFQLQWRIPHHHHRVLVLQTASRKLLQQTHRRSSRTTGEPMKLLRVGGERAAFAQRADQTPRIAAVNRLILTGGDHLAVLRMSQGGVIEVLTDIKLIQAN